MPNCIATPWTVWGVIALMPPFSASPILRPPFADCEAAHYETN